MPSFFRIGYTDMSVVISDVKASTFGRRQAVHPELEGLGPRTYWEADIHTSEESSRAGGAYCAVLDGADTFAHLVAEHRLAR